MVHELVHAFRRHHKIDTLRLEYDYDPEEYECILWEIRWLKYLKYSYNTIIRKIRVETGYPKVFIDLLMETI